MWNGIAWTLLFLTTTLFAQTNNIERLNSITNLSRIAFGSCNDQKDAQPLWKDLMTTKPELFIWGGDAIYADWERSYNMAGSYQKQKDQPDYQAFANQTPIIGTWDDHDYSKNNADGTLLTKRDSQQQFLDFIEEPEGSLRRLQEGIYTSYEFGDDDKRIKVILLDNRYFKNLEADARMLGNMQWKWLEKELTNSKAKIHFIVAGLSIFSPLLPYTEEWGETGDMNRMLKLLTKTKPSGVLFLTGDKHFGSIFKRYNQLEFMSSGMTHVAPRKTWWYLGQKYPTTFFGLNYGLIDIAWEEGIPLLTLSIRNNRGEDIHRSKVKWQTDTWTFIR